jgi:HK97 family phage prohead protease/HK97 family phage major capsid protein
MAKKTFWLNSRIDKAVEDEGKLKITGYASTNDTDRVGDVIPPEAWTRGGLDNYKKNPIILFNHKYDQPIGRATELEVDNKGLKLTAVISDKVPQYDLIKDGILSTFSVGFLVNDADYDKDKDGFIIKDAELLETSVVSVPCNQDACFSLAKSFANKNEFKQFLKKELDIDTQDSPPPEPEANASEPGEKDEPGAKAARETNRMDEAEIQRLAEEAATRMFTQQKEAEEEARKKAEEKAAEEERIKEAAKVAAEAASKSTEEKLLADFEAKLKENNENFEKTFGEFKEALEAKTDELKAFRESKRNFSDRGGSSDDWKSVFKNDLNDAFLLARVTGKGYETDFAKQLAEKVNTHSSVTVPSAAWETAVSNDIERDIQNELIITPLFREINMTAANMSIPIMPDAGYAEITANTTASGTQPNGNLDRRGAPYGAPYEGITLSEISLNTIKMISLAFLGNETEEDAVIPILPLIRESMIRSHVRGVENMILAGNDPDGVYTSGAQKGLIAYARTGGRMVTAAGTATPLDAGALFGLRRVMGKYGVRPSDVVYIVSQQAYFELIQDAEFQDADLVGNQATKLTGEIGSVYGSRILMSDEFAAPGAGRFYALAVNIRNFVVPRLRGLTVESDYEVREQRRVLVTSQRLGFTEIIPDAMSVVGLRYATA